MEMRSLKNRPFNRRIIGHSTADKQKTANQIVSPVRPPRAPLQTIDQTSPSKRPKMAIDPNVTFNTSGSNTSSSARSNEAPSKIEMPADEEEGREKSP
jgi:hypothetical protein